jgi:two-component system, chemotaxis family, protein-glutamate methylesterase/glutaminase
LNRNQRITSSLNEKKTTVHHHKYSKIELSKNSQLNNWNPLKHKIVLIGTSTGGPNALQTVLTKLPENIDVPIVIVQHMPPGFTSTLANRLNSLSKITVKEAEDGEILLKGTAYIAPGGYQLTLKSIGNKAVAHIDKSTKSCLHCPSVDLLLSSAVVLKEFAKIVVIMTGMGSDGVSGLKHLKKTDEVKAIAESQETCVVFGMPKAAIATGLIDEVHTVENIADTIMKYL